MSDIAVSPSVSTQRPSKALHIGLWVAQVLLAAMFGMAGVMKTTTPYADLASQMSWVPVMGEAMLRFIGISELAGAIGLILPALTRIRPSLTGWAGVGLTVVMILAAGFHAIYSEFSAIPMNVVLGGLAAFVAWGRLRRAPIAPRA